MPSGRIAFAVFHPAESYGPEDHRHDHRVLVYPPLYDSLPAKKMDAAVEKMEAESTAIMKTMQSRKP
ncbi:MAG: hypothetical protein ALECFALPRED_010457 [Alectoria fallacina]|uniref:Uncharacterized protein n=1 Tax=Alectoria fallacina TaxID=1903189 RepID=A0A8H3PKS3_9LECA|nr:MAG: hypothetical protein ALECFALPRED_010457 [Alectoria fallacina]